MGLASLTYSGLLRDLLPLLHALENIIRDIENETHQLVLFYIASPSLPFEKIQIGRKRATTSEKGVVSSLSESLIVMLDHRCNVLQCQAMGHEVLRLTPNLLDRAFAQR
eukprot:4966448-Amphidinium_carterae.1